MYFRRSNSSYVIHVNDVHTEDDRALADLRQSNHELLKRSKGHDVRFPINNGNIITSHSIIIDIHKLLVSNYELGQSVSQYSSDHFLLLLAFEGKFDSQTIYNDSSKPVHNNNIAWNNKAYSLIA